MKKQVTRKEYIAVHSWLRDTFGNAIACENPKCEKKSQSFEYAIKAGKTHKKIRANYMTLCVPCHRKYDMEHKNNGHQMGISTTRLSMKLLWMLYAESSADQTYGIHTIPTFLKFVEDYIKSSRP